MDSQRKNSGVRPWSFHALCHLLGDVWLQHELSSLSYRAISLITYGPRDRCYWIQCEPDNTRAELLITFVLNVKGTDAVCISRCEHVLWVWTVASRFRVSLPNWWSSGSNADLSRPLYLGLSTWEKSCSYLFIQWKSDSRESSNVTWNYSHKSSCDRSVIGACLYVIRTFNLLNTLAMLLSEVVPESLNHSI